MEPLGSPTSGTDPGARAMQILGEHAARRQQLDALGNANVPMASASALQLLDPPKTSAPASTAPPCIPPAPEPSDNWIEYLAALPPTERLRDELATIATRQQEMRDRGATLSAGRLDFVRERLEQQVRWGEERDALQAKRPQGCWCLGLGGKSRADLPPDANGEIHITYLVPCTCQDAAAMTARAVAARELRTRSLLEERLTRVFGTPELAGYEDARIDGMQVEPINAVYWELCQAWLDPRRPEISDLSLLITGPVGTGKTFLALALMRARIEAGQAALFLDLGDFLDQIKATFGRAADGSDGPTTAEVLEAPRRVPLLVLDDLGAEYGTAWAESQIFGLLNARWKAQSATIFTTNHTTETLREHAGERIASRVLGMCGGLDANIIRWQGRDRRLGTA